MRKHRFQGSAKVSKFVPFLMHLNAFSIILHFGQHSVRTFLHRHFHGFASFCLFHFLTHFYDDLRRLKRRRYKSFTSIGKTGVISESVILILGEFDSCFFDFDDGCKHRSITLFKSLDVWKAS